MTTQQTIIESNNEEATFTEFDMVAYLPVEIAQKILFYLSPEDLRSAISCVSWNAAVRHDDYFWRRLCQREGYFEMEETNRSEFYTSFFKGCSYWQGVYWYNHTLQRNWETYNYREITYKLEEPYSIFQWHIFDDGFACVSLNSKKFYVYILKENDLTTVCLQEEDIDIFGGMISKSGKYVINFNYAKSLTVWDLETGLTVLNKLWKHVTDVLVYKDLIVLETLHEKLEVYNVQTGQIEFEWKGIITNEFIMDGRMVFTTMDHVIHILKWDDKSLVTLTCCNETEVHNLLIKNNILLSLCSKKDTLQMTLCVWNITSKTKLRSVLLGSTLNGLQSTFFMNKYLYLRRYEDMDEDDNFSYSIELWDYMKGTHEVALSCEIKRNLSCENKILNNHFMIATHDSTLAMWCLKTRDFICDFNFNEFDENIFITETKLAYLVADSPDILIYETYRMPNFQPLLWLWES